MDWFVLAIIIRTKNICDLIGYEKRDISEISYFTSKI